MLTRKKISLTILVLLALIVIALVVVAPRLADVDRYRPEVVERLERQTGRPVAIRRLTLTLLPTLAIRADDFALGNPPGFPPGDAVRVRRIDAELAVGALWSHRIVIKSLNVDQPTLTLLSGPRGRWNLENPPGASDAGGLPGQRGSTPPTIRIVEASLISPAAFSLGAISEVNIEGGHVTVANLTPSGEPGPIQVEATGIASQLRQVDLRALLAFDSAEFAVRPAVATPPSPVAEGNLTIASVRFGAVEATTVKSDLRIQPQQLFFDGLNFNLCGGHSQGGVTLNFSGLSLVYGAKIQFSGVDMASLLEAFPGARGKLTGKAEGHLDLTGKAVSSPDPLAGKQGAGWVNIRDGQLPTLELNKNLMQLLGAVINSSSGHGDASSFSSLSADLDVAGGKITSQKITIVGNGVELDASGGLVLEGAGQLNYEGVAKVEANQKNAFSKFAAGMLGAKISGGKFSFGFTLGGTLQAPRFALKSKQSPLNQLLNGLRR